ncbi:MAG: thiamine-phosphate kinase [Chloroflexota bacterium]|nr:thiamine-phosphate kinase [Chloroflexota bacterium]
MIQYNIGMYVRDIGEFALIERLAKQIELATTSSRKNKSGPSNLLVTIGDDTAAWISNHQTELLTTDTVVEGVHFLPETSTWQSVGWKGLASNLSDIASMGGIPAYAVVTLGLPQDTLIQDVEKLYAGLLEAANTFGTNIVGGDIVASPVFFMTIGLTGVTTHAPMLRSNAQPGDQIATTGTLGGSVAGLAILLDNQIPQASKPQPLINKHQRPRPRITEGQLLVKAGVTCATDLSDGLLINLGTICDRSGHAAHIDTTLVPVDQDVIDVFPESALSMALSGGEDYELLFTAPPYIMTTLQSQLEQEMHVIGTIEAKRDHAFNNNLNQIFLFDADGKPVELPDSGWDHFRR